MAIHNEDDTREAIESWKEFSVSAQQIRAKQAIEEGWYPYFIAIESGADTEVTINGSKKVMIITGEDNAIYNIAAFFTKIYLSLLKKVPGSGFHVRVKNHDPLHHP